MTDPSEITPNSASQGDQTDAPAEALLCLTQSAKDFLKYQSLYAEGAEVKKTLSLKEAEIRKKDEKIKELDSAITVMAHGGQKEVIRMKLEKAEILKEKNNLNTKLQQALKEKEDVANRLRMTRTEVEEYATYKANLVNLDLSKLLYCLSAVRLALKIWRKYGNAHTIYRLSFLHRPSGSIPIPLINSFAAKLARNAVMLNVFTLVFVRWIFTATPPPLAQAGLDVILSELIEQDERKEALCRAILLSAPSGNPPQDIELQLIVKWILEAFGTLLLLKPRTELKSDVKSLMTEATNCWVKSRWSRQKVIATLDYESCPGSWRDHPVPSHKHQQSMNAEVSDPEDQEEVTLVAFPAIVAMSNGTQETIHPGFLIRYSHLYEAEIEWRNEQKTRRFSRSGVPYSIPGLPSLRGAAGAMV
ncbi:hypothetical protein K469DRAFT_730544 [Zopfia rhizophila CBS 207.26]|uniref:Uncharacterized protein n=1 Tax=Zopfia rhizophila CBS 207.26 TaxID=1314779 RepID=A0A6A6DJQ7_9PEZI|nr:hypothetical protein K469DRAFT_730544 [Zopfia rhizophila CBS 207.26]